ncbi:hypothetical protein EYF80_033516 [Liparis tanakae]|uniref:Uncharacterized protein n=1 Tax=Liparis tanakae TaxID=230148 RepID=A0A4Z2GSU9_9TELE|nr:hypothetical protein EYF80_033516 [Liparis tanakae]
MKGKWSCDFQKRRKATWETPKDEETEREMLHTVESIIDRKGGTVNFDPGRASRALRPPCR